MNNKKKKKYSTLFPFTGGEKKTILTGIGAGLVVVIFVLAVLFIQQIFSNRRAAAAESAAASAAAESALQGTLEDAFDVKKPFPAKPGAWGGGRHGGGGLWGGINTWSDRRGVIRTAFSTKQLLNNRRH